MAAFGQEKCLICTEPKCAPVAMNPVCHWDCEIILQQLFKTAFRAITNSLIDFQILLMLLVGFCKDFLAQPTSSQLLNFLLKFLANCDDLV